MQERDAYFMGLALEQARAALAQQEVPVGAVVVCGEAVVGKGHNRVITDRDPSAHAEIVALREAARTLDNYRLDACELFVTLEPCTMCWGAVQHSRIRRLVYGASDSHSPTLSLQHVPAMGARGGELGHAQVCTHCLVEGGCCEHECGDLLRGFFQERRRTQSQDKEALREDALRPEPHTRSQLPGDEWPALGCFVSPPLQALQGLRLHLWQSWTGNAPRKPSLLVCLHGHGAWAWQFQALMRAPGTQACDVLLVDRPGHGWSDKTKKGWEHDPAVQMGALAELLERYPHEHIELVAHDGAAPLAWGLAQLLARVRRVSLLNPCAYGTMLCAQEARPDKPQHAPMDWTRVTTQAGLRRWAAQQPGSGTGVPLQDALLLPMPDDGHVRAWSRYVRSLQFTQSSGMQQAPHVLTERTWQLHMLCNEQHRGHASRFCTQYGIVPTDGDVQICANSDNVVALFGTNTACP